MHSRGLFLPIVRRALLRGLPLLRRRKGRVLRRVLQVRSEPRDGQAGLQRRARRDDQDQMGGRIARGRRDEFVDQTFAEAEAKPTIWHSFLLAGALML